MPRPLRPSLCSCWELPRLSKLPNSPFCLPGRDALPHPAPSSNTARDPGAQQAPGLGSQWELTPAARRSCRLASSRSSPGALSAEPRGAWARTADRTGKESGKTSPHASPPALPRPRVAAARSCTARATKHGAGAGPAGLRVRGARSADLGELGLGL